MQSCASLGLRFEELRAERAGDSRALAVLDALDQYRSELCRAG
jgi:hypothetical protein